MKRKIAGILAVIMILCMSTTAFAANSPTGDDVVFDKVSNSASATPGQPNVNVGKVSKDVYEEAKKETSGAIVSMAEVKLNNIANTDLAKGVPVSLCVSTLTTGDNVNTIRIMHKRSSDGRWEIITPLSVDPVSKTVTITLYEFSPLAIVRYEAGKAPDSTQNIPSNGNNTSNGSMYEQVSSTLKPLDGEKIIKVTKVDKYVYEEAVKETTGAIVSMANIALNNIADANLSKGVSVSVYVSSLTADDSVSTIRLLHKRSNDNKWEVIVPTSVNPATKVVTATFYDFSPVAVVRYAVGNAPGSTQYIPNGVNENPADDPQNPENPEEPEDPDDNWGDPDDGWGDSDDKPTKPSDDKDKLEVSDKDNVKPGKDNVKPNKDQNGNSTIKQEKPSAGNSNAKPAASAVHVSSASSAQTSPKTGSSMPVLPAIAMFSLMGIAYCGKKAKNL